MSCELGGRGVPGEREPGKTVQWRNEERVEKVVMVRVPQGGARQPGQREVAWPLRARVRRAVTFELLKFEVLPPMPATLTSPPLWLIITSGQWWRQLCLAPLRRGEHHPSIQYIHTQPPSNTPHRAAGHYCPFLMVLALTGALIYVSVAGLLFAGAVRSSSRWPLRVRLLWLRVVSAASQWMGEPWSWLGSMVRGRDRLNTEDKLKGYHELARVGSTCICTAIASR